MGNWGEMIKEVLVVSRQQAIVGVDKVPVQASKDNGGNGGGHTFIRFKKIDKLIDHLKDIQDTQFTGYIKINFSQGNIGRVEKFEEILKG
jgi:hypothetical protein